MQASSQQATSTAEVILGSSSIWRKAIMEKSRIPFSVHRPNINEKSIRHSNPINLTMALAEAKADAIVQRLENHHNRENIYLITSDQVVVVGGEILEKPTSKSEMRSYLAKYSVSAPSFVTSVHVRHLGSGKFLTDFDIVDICFSQFNDQDFKQIVEDDFWRLCAGGITLEREPFKSKLNYINGTPQSAKGLPMHLVKDMLEKLGYACEE